MEAYIHAYHEILQETNHTIVETPLPMRSDNLKRTFSYILRKIIHNIFSRLFAGHNRHLSYEQKQIFVHNYAAVIRNIHTKFETQQVSSILERPIQP